MVTERLSTLKQYKQESKERSAALGEVFTPEWVVNDMLNGLEKEGNPNAFKDITTTFFDICCGTGNFTVQILKRKFDNCKTKKQFIAALESTYASDIMEDNIEECRRRVIDLYHSYGQNENIDFIVRTNIFQSDVLAVLKLLATDNEEREIYLKTLVEAKDEF